MSKQLPANELVLYDDEDCKIEASDVDLGRLPLGMPTQIRKYLKNHSDKWPFQNIRLTSEDSEISADLPTVLPPNTVVPVTVTFTPSMARREPLRVDNLIIGELWIG